MSASEELSKILARLEGEAVRISLSDGDIYDLQIKSADKATEKGSFDTEIIWAMKNLRHDPVETGASMELKLDDVAKVEVLRNAKCVYERPIPPVPPTSDPPPLA